MLNAKMQADDRIVKFADDLGRLMVKKCNREINAQDFSNEFANALTQHDNATYKLIAVAEGRDLTMINEWVVKHGIHPNHVLPCSQLNGLIQTVSDDAYTGSNQPYPFWRAAQHGNRLAVTACVSSTMIYAAIFERMDAGHPILPSFKEAVARSYTDISAQAPVTEVLATRIRQATDTAWRLLESPLAVTTIVQEDFAAVFPSYEFLETLCVEMEEALKPFYNTPFVVTSQTTVGRIGAARCMEVCLEARDEDLLYRAKALLTLDDESLLDKAPVVRTLSSTHILESIPDSGDRSRNEPVYLMSAKATRSLLDGQSLDRSLDVIRRVSKQQGWSDVQAFGQQLLFIS